MRRRDFVSLAAAAPAILKGQAPRRPNILLLFSDDHAYQAISAYGSKLNQTPNIDRIGREGAVFENGLVTNSICAPSRAVTLTGKYSHLNGVLDNAIEFDGSQVTFPKLLRQAGYSTAMIGKWHLKSNPTGFDHWEVLPGQGNYYNPDFITAAGRKRREGYTTDLIAEMSIDWLKNGRDPQKPFLLMSQHKAPHRNWMPGPKHLSRYEDSRFPEPPNLYDNYQGRSKAASEQEMEIGRHMSMTGDLKVPMPEGTRGADPKGFANEYSRMSAAQKRMWDAAYARRIESFNRLKPEGRDLIAWKYQEYMKDYLRCIASVDDAVGEVTRYLDAEGLADNTIVIYMSDQGFYLGEHGWFDKRWIYEESVRTPLLMKWPGVARGGGRIAPMSANVDIAPTLLDAAGVQVPAEMQGRSLRPLLAGQTPPDWRKSFYYHYYEETVHHVARHYGVRTDRYTMAHFYTHGEWELYDRQSDPNQMRNVYNDPKYASVRKELTAELTRLRAELKVPAVDPDRKA